MTKLDLPEEVMVKHISIRYRSTTNETKHKGHLMIARPLAVIRVLATIIPLCGLLCQWAAAYEPTATSAWVYDMASQTVLLEKDAKRPLPPASMSKLMTINMLFEAIKDGRVRMDTTFRVSPHAKAMDGSTMFLQEDDLPTVQELILGIIVNSGNDACIVVAEGLAGSEETFAKQMTQRAHELGMQATNLVNSSGWPDPRHRMSMEDLGIITKRLIEEFPEYYHFFSVKSFNYKERAPANSSNRNPLLYLNIGADGLKTGHTEEAGHGLVGSAIQKDRRVIFVISGLQSDADRAKDSQNILDWAYRQFNLKTLAKAGEPLAKADVWLGKEDQVGLALKTDMRLLVPAVVTGPITANVVYKAPLTAPIKAGEQVAELIVKIPGFPPTHAPLFAQRDVIKAGFFKRLRIVLKMLYADYILSDQNS